jgi:hypothetical protein
MVTSRDAVNSINWGNVIGRPAACFASATVELLLNSNSNSSVELCSGKLLNFSQYYYPLEYFDGQRISTGIHFTSSGCPVEGKNNLPSMLTNDGMTLSLLFQ